jgi:hypothetical protein
MHTAPLGLVLLALELQRLGRPLCFLLLSATLSIRPPPSLAHALLCKVYRTVARSSADIVAKTRRALRLCAFFRFVRAVPILRMTSNWIIV